MYAKYDDSQLIRRDDTAHAHAVCITDLENRKYDLFTLLNGDRSSISGITVYFTVSLLIPFIFLTLTATVVRSLHRSVHVRIIKHIHHKNVAGLALTGMFVTFYVVLCDGAAVYFAFFDPNNELNKIPQLRATPGYITIAILLLFDVIVCLTSVAVVLLYNCCINLHRENDCGETPIYCLKYVLSRFFALPFYIIFGTLRQDDLWNIPNNDDNAVSEYRTVWVIMSSLIAPLFVISSHAGFILVSWLTNTSQASSVALISLAVVIFLFFMFRQCYDCNSKREAVPLLFKLSYTIIIIHQHKYRVIIIRSGSHGPIM